MPGEPDVLKEFYENWKAYMDTVKVAIAPLTREQLDLRAAPEERSVGEIIQHVVAARIDWFCDFMGEQDEMIEVYRPWTNASELKADAPELAKALDTSWQMVADRLDRWTAEDLAFTFPLEWRGDHYDLTRSWVVWHILEHDLIHGGEVSLTLGMHRLNAPRP